MVKRLTSFCNEPFLLSQLRMIYFGLFPICIIFFFPNVCYSEIDTSIIKIGNTWTYSSLVENFDIGTIYSIRATDFLRIDSIDFRGDTLNLLVMQIRSGNRESKGSILPINDTMNKEYSINLKTGKGFTSSLFWYTQIPIFLVGFTFSDSTSSIELNGQNHRVSYSPYYPYYHYIENIGLDSLYQSLIIGETGGKTYQYSLLQFNGNTIPHNYSRTIFSIIQYRKPSNETTFDKFFFLRNTVNKTVSYKLDGSTIGNNYNATGIYIKHYPCSEYFHK